jgi:hypothetical protein
MAGVAVNEGRDLSEGELEDGEVLSSEGEDEGEVEKEENADQDTPQENDKTFGKQESSTPVIGTKRSAEEDSSIDAPDPKAAKFEPSDLAPGEGGNGGTSEPPRSSDVEEGEIFSDDEEAAYFPQRIKSRGTTGTATVVPSDASGSEDKKTKSSRWRGTSNSPERDSSQQRSSRRHRSRERGRDSEPKSLASLFFEDRDGTTSEQSDDGREGRGRRKGERFRHSSSPGSTSSRSGRDRDRDRSSSTRDQRDRRGGEGRSHYRTTKDSHNRHGGGEREKDWDHDSNGDSSEEETASSSWSQGKGGKGYSHHHRRGRRGGGGHYQSKFGQKHDRFGADSRGSGGRSGGRDTSNWGSGKMTAKELQAQAENVRKRREKGLSLLQTPKMKPSDNLDEFNYPAPPSWYLEAVEKWEKEREEKEKAGAGGGGVPLTIQQPQPLVAAASMPQPQPLFPPSTQFIHTQQQNPMADVTNTSLLGEPPRPLIPVARIPPAGLQPPMPPQIPSLFPPPLPSLVPPLQLQPLIQPSSLVPPPPLPLVRPIPPPNNPALGSTAATFSVAAPPRLHVVGGGPRMVAVSSEGYAFQLGTAGVANEAERGGKAVVSTVRVSSLALDITNRPGEGGAKEMEVDDEEDDEEGRMKIALETPTPQPSATDAKTFSFFRAESDTDRGAAVDKGSPGTEKDNSVKCEKDTEPTENTSASDDKDEKKEGEDKMEVDDSTSEKSLPVCPTESQPGATAGTSGDLTKPSDPLPLSTPSAPPVTTANPTSSDPVVYADIKTYSPPPLALLQPPSSSFPSSPPPTSPLPAPSSSTAATTAPATTVSGYDTPRPTATTTTSAPLPTASERSAPPAVNSAATAIGFDVPPIATGSGLGVSFKGSRGGEGRGGDNKGEHQRQVQEESDMEEGDFDYDKYLDQLDEEEDGVEVPSSALVGAISTSLLQNNPLDEDFPAINPSTASTNRKDETLKSLLVGESGLDVSEESSKGSSRGRGSKSERRKQKENEWWSKRRNSNKPRANSPALRPPCKFYLNGFCKQGEGCQFSHEGSPRPKKKKERCKFFLQDTCTKGDDCRFYHGEFPCKFFHTVSGCKNGDSCKFSHAPLTEETTELLAQVLEPARTPTKWADPAPVLGFPPANPANHHDGVKLVHGPDAKINIQYFSTAAASDPAARRPSDSNLASPLLISIPKQVLETSLVVSIPRQKLGPPFGTIRIPPSHPAPANQPQIPPHSLPRHSAPQPTLPSPHSATPLSSNFRPPLVPPTGTPFLVPPQSGPPANFLGAVPPPIHGQPQGNLPPRPPGGWQAPPPQPVPLFPAPPGGLQNIPQVPLAQPPPPHMAAQFPPPPSSERKCLLPTPPSHMRLDPMNILWSEDDRPEYWEAPGTAPFGHQPPPGGSFAPPPPHVPQPQAIGGIPQQQPPISSTTPRNQSVPLDRMDPRQNRMEPRPGGSMDPRHGGPLANPHQPGMGDPRHHISNGALGSSTLPPTVPPYQPPHPGTTPIQSAPRPAGYQGPHPPSQGWAHPPPPQPNLRPQFPIPIPPVPINPAQPPPHGGQPGRPGTFGSPAPYQQPHPSSSSGLAPLTNWGSASPESSAVPSPSTGRAVPPPSAGREGEQSRPHRVDPRTKYSHLKIKSKSAASSASGGGGLKGEGGERPLGAAIDRTHMPKLLQEPPALQRPYDPHELFDSAASREVESDYAVSGPFVSTFGSFFTRSSPPQASSTGKSSGLPYGEITMQGITEKEPATVQGKQDENTVEAASSQTHQGPHVDENDKSNSTKSPAVPSYLAELGVDSDLTIDSAFSSLKGGDTAGETGSGEKNEVMAKKLPSIFGFGSGTS